MSGWTRDRGLWLAALLYVALSVVWAAPSSLSPWDRVPDLGDPLHLGYVMAWDAHQLIRRPWALFDSNSFYPYPRSLAFGDHLLPEALMVAPVNWLSGNAVLASNVSVLLGLTLSALFMFVLVRGVTGSWGAGLLSGLVYAFNSFTRHELLRVHVLHLEWWPLALLGLIRFVREGRARDAALFASGLLLQGLSGAYYLVCTVLIAPLWLLSAYLVVGRRPSLREARILALALVAASAFAIPILWPYVGHLRSYGFAKALVDGPDLLCYLTPPSTSTLYGGFRWFNACFGVTHFIGYLTVALSLVGAGAALARRRELTGWLALLTALVGLVLSLGPVIRVGGTVLLSGPFRWLWELLPPVRGMDGSRRMGVLVILGGALLVGLAYRHVLGRLSRPVRLAVAGLIACWLPLEHWTKPPSATPVPTGRELPAVYRSLASTPTEPVIELPLYPEVSPRYWAIYPYFSTYHWRPIPIGRTSFYPPSHHYLVWCLEDFPGPISLAMLDRLGIRTIVVHPLVWENDVRAERLKALESEPRLALVRRYDDRPPERYWDWGLGDERVYRLIEAVPASRPCAPVGELPRAAWQLRSLAKDLPEQNPPPLRHFADWVRGREWRMPWVAEWARDGDRTTAWTTARDQRTGDGLEVTFARPEQVAVVTVDLGYPFDEFPRRLVLVGRSPGGERRRIPYDEGPDARWETLQGLLKAPRQARMILRFSPRTLQGITVRIGGTDEMTAWPRWTVPELRSYGDCR